MSASAFDFIDGGHIRITTLPLREHAIQLCACDPQGFHADIVLTPAEAQELAQRLLKEAAEVQFAASLNTAADGGES